MRLNNLILVTIFYDNQSLSAAVITLWYCGHTPVYVCTLYAPVVMHITPLWRTGYLSCDSAWLDHWRYAPLVNAMGPRQWSPLCKWHFQFTFLYENCCTLTWLSFDFVPKGPIAKRPSLGQIVPRRPTSENPLSAPVMDKLTDAYASFGVDEFRHTICWPNLHRLISAAIGRWVTSDPAELPFLPGRKKLCTNAVEYNL